MQDKKATLSKKIKSYSALAGSVLAIGATAKAQVVYTDVSPDSLINTSGGFFNLDLNHDGTVDFQLITKHVTTSGYVYDYVSVNASQGVNAVDTIAGGNADTLSAGVNICSTSLFVDSTTKPFAGLLAFQLTVPSAFTTGNFVGKNGKFVGLRFTKAGQMYYGWVRLNVATNAKSFTVIDYAYKNSPSACDMTGLTTDVGISESALADQVIIYSAEKSIYVKLDQNLHPEGIISVTNILGQNVLKTAVTNSEMIIPMQDAKTGVYLVTITQSTGSYTKRISIQ